MKPVDGQAWERAIGDLLRIPELPIRQRGGRSMLFSTRAASGVAHELDACSSGGGKTIIVECESQRVGVLKAEAALFHEKTLDFFFAEPAVSCNERWWRILVSSTPVRESIRTFCVHLGIMLVEPEHLPLPVVLWIASQLQADLYLREPLLQDMVRLGEATQLALQHRWVYDARTSQIQLSPSAVLATDIRDLLWLQEELGSDILDLYDLHRPGQLEHWSAELERILRLN